MKQLLQDDGNTAVAMAMVLSLLLFLGKLSSILSLLLPQYLSLFVSSLLLSSHYMSLTLVLPHIFTYATGYWQNTHITYHNLQTQRNCLPTIRKQKMPTRIKIHTLLHFIALLPVCLLLPSVGGAAALCSTSTTTEQLLPQLPSLPHCCSNSNYG